MILPRERVGVFFIIRLRFEINGFLIFGAFGFLIFGILGFLITGLRTDIAIVS